ncbi:HET-domain-containing protein [Cenococcum geophilum 1.58]|uniref:HET-domain-containing protein n=1 Tax=Cenococcum geophilum 1.58 TaxID=794803 RepID=UPI00358E29E1|nr:HET-domain-containing protein [Cenococcum geophilum 1.58]
MASVKLCEICSGIDFQRHIFGDNGLQYNVKDVDIGSIGDIITRKRLCSLCQLLEQSFDTTRISKDAHCILQAVHFCLCPMQWSAKHDEFLECHHPRHVDFIVESEKFQSVTFQVCLNPVPRGFGLDGDSDRLLGETHASRFSGRLFEETADPVLFKKWLDLCESHHGDKCHLPIWPRSPPQPENLLVIDVKHSCVTTAPPACRFVALSYVWGSAKQKKLTHADWPILSQKGALEGENIPATIKDAIQVTEAIGEQYCWIDTLCIFQDDPASQQDQISQMGAIYSRALLTIVAAAGDAGSGLQGVRPGTRDVRQDIIHLPTISLLKIVDDSTSPLSIYDRISPWQTRAWTFQERLFSRRLLIFREKQIYWHCKTASWLEEKFLESEEPVKMNVLELLVHDDVTIPRSLAEWKPCYRSVKTESDKFYEIYSRLLRGYSVRQLSFGSDILNAFAGATRALALLGGDEFIWGLPKSHFANSLTWTISSVSNRRRNTCSQTVLMQDGTARELPFPTWSWSSWCCGGARNIRTSEKGTALESCIITFYSRLISGKLVRITQSSPVHTSAGVSRSPAPQWLELPQTIEKLVDITAGEEVLHSGFLTFWTSTATIYFFIERPNPHRRGPPRHTCLSTTGEVLKAIPCSSSLKTAQGDDLDVDHEISILDLVIIGGEALVGAGTISRLSGNGRMLHALSARHLKIRG